MGTPPKTAAQKFAFSKIQFRLNAAAAVPLAVQIPAALNPAPAEGEFMPHGHLPMVVDGRTAQRGRLNLFKGQRIAQNTVSYTHLTLPTMEAV